MWEDFKGRILCHFLPLFHTLIINPRLVIFKSVTSAKLSVFNLQLISSSSNPPCIASPFAFYSITRSGNSCSLLRQSRSSSPPFLSHPLLLLLSPRTVRDGDWFLPSYLPLHICFMQTSQSSSRWSVCLLYTERKKQKNKVGSSARTSSLSSVLFFVNALLQLLRCRRKDL